MACPFCKFATATVNERGGRANIICSRCGRYSLSDIAMMELENNQLTDRQIANASGYLRDHTNIYIRNEDLDSLFRLKTPSVSYRADKLLIELENRTSVIGASVPVTEHMPEANDLMGVTWSATASEVGYLCRIYLEKEKGFVVTSGNALNGAVITPKGYGYLDEIRKVQQESQIGFCAMWFNDQVENIWTDAIVPAIQNAGYEPKRIDHEEHNNKIDDEIIATIRRSRFLVTDFTGQRGGVYFEAGFAVGLAIPVIWTVREDDLANVHFDNRQYNFIAWRMDGLPTFAQKLQNRIEATIGRGPLRQ